MLNRAILMHSGQKLLPLHKPEIADEMPFNLASNTRFRRGQLVGQVTGSQNDVQTITVTGGPASGNFTLLVRDPRSGGWALVEVPYNATAGVLQGLLNPLLGAGNTVVSGGNLPGTPLVVTAAGAYVNMPLNVFSVEATAFGGGASPAVTVAHTAIGRTKATVAPYPGTSPAIGIISYEITTDSGGNGIFGPTAVEGYNGEVFKDALCYVRGYFDTKKLIGLDQAALDAGFGRLVNGTIADGEILIGG